MTTKERTNAYQTVIKIYRKSITIESETKVLPMGVRAGGGFRRVTEWYQNNTPMIFDKLIPYSLVCAIAYNVLQFLYEKDCIYL